MIPITNVAGTPHVTPKQDAMFHRGMAGADNCVYNFLESFEPEVSSNQNQGAVGNRTAPGAIVLH